MLCRTSTYMSFFLSVISISLYLSVSLSFDISFPFSHQSLFHYFSLLLPLLSFSYFSPPSPFTLFFTLFLSFSPHSLFHNFSLLSPLTLFFPISLSFSSHSLFHYFFHRLPSLSLSLLLILTPTTLSEMLSLCETISYQAMRDNFVPFICHDESRELCFLYLLIYVFHFQHK